MLETLYAIKKIFFSIYNEDRLSKGEINLIFSKTKEGDKMYFLRYHSENKYLYIL